MKQRTILSDREKCIEFILVNHPGSVREQLDRLSGVQLLLLRIKTEMNCRNLLDKDQNK